MSKNINYQRITDTDGQEVIVMVIKVHRSNIDKDIDAFICIDDDDVEAINYGYEITPEMKAVNLGSYEQFTGNQDRIDAYHSILKHQNKANGPLSTVRAIDYLVKYNASLNEANVLIALKKADNLGISRVNKIKEQIAQIRA